LAPRNEAVRVDGEGLVPAGLGTPGAWAAFAQRAGIVEGDVEPAEPFDRKRDQGPGVILGADVARQCGGLAALGFDLGDQAR